MRWHYSALLAASLAACSSTPTSLPVTTAPSTPDPVDPYLWLEEVDGEQALDWVRAQNERSVAELSSGPEFAQLQDRLLAVLDSDDRIPYVQKQGDYVYNFWRDTTNPRGLWRRTTLQSYVQGETKWETVIDVDALAKAEDENWVWAGSSCRKPDYDRCLISLSRGGADASVMREFDLRNKRFVEGGFELPESKGGMSWIDLDQVYVFTDFGSGSMTSSGYPRIVKRWQRGTSLDSAETVYEGLPEDVYIGAAVIHERGQTHHIIQRAPTFFTNEVRLLRNGAWQLVDKPDDAEVGLFGDHLTINLRKPWTTGGKDWPAGSLLIAEAEPFLDGERSLQAIFTPDERRSLGGTSSTRNYMLVTELDNVRTRIYAWSLQDGNWQRETVEVPELSVSSIGAVDSDESDDYFLTTSDFTTPTSLYYGRIGDAQRTLVRQLPAFFDATGLEINQYQAESADGTRIPYFQVNRKDMQANGRNPTLLNGYGGFEVPRLPSYSATVGAGWLEEGGVFVLANIRGGGEFGPQWHQAALKENRQRSFDDFIAIAEDLIARGVTSPRHLGIQGGSNGGLLMGAMLTQRPDLFGAIVCQVPLLDMRRYHLLLAGASWMAEYGNPDDPADWAYLQRYSPYQNLRPDADYPRVLFTTSTRDDRVHPGHARKMAARMAEQGHDFLYYENMEGGHGGAANNVQAAFMAALSYRYLEAQLR